MYADDLLLAAPMDQAVVACKQILLDAFTVRDMQEPTYFLGRHVGRGREEGVLILRQRQYAPTILDRFNMSDSNPVRRPMSVGVVLQRDGTALDTPMATKDQEVVGALLFLATCTRPDISFAVGELSRHVSASAQAHWAAAKAFMSYLQGMWNK